MSQQINLYEARLRPRHLLLTGQRLAIALVAVLVLTGGLAFFVRSQADQVGAEVVRGQAEVKALQDKHDALVRQLAERKIPAALQIELDNARAMQGVRKEVVALLDSGKLGHTDGFSKVFYGFSRQATGDLWLSGFTVSLGGQEIEIRGKLLDAAKLPGYVQRLGLDPAFQGRRFAALTMDSVDPVEVKPGVVASVVPVTPVQTATPRLPRHVEFVLRSEHGGEPDKSVEGRK